MNKKMMKIFDISDISQTTLPILEALYLTNNFHHHLLISSTSANTFVIDRDEENSDKFHKLIYQQHFFLSINQFSIHYTIQSMYHLITISIRQRINKFLLIKNRVHIISIHTLHLCSLCSYVRCVYLR
jgi:hypothetical protein